MAQVYGVTSEGVTVFLETALTTALGIDPRKQPFSVKITGGTDGDVAGNEVAISFRPRRRCTPVHTCRARCAAVIDHCYREHRR